MRVTSHVLREDRLFTREHFLTDELRNLVVRRLRRLACLVRNRFEFAAVPQRKDRAHFGGCCSQQRRDRQLREIDRRRRFGHIEREPVQHAERVGGRGPFGANANPALITEMIAIYLEQTPPLVSAMKESFEQKNWQSLYAAVHKMIPSFSIMGLGEQYENMAKKVQEYARLHSEAGQVNLLMQTTNGTTNHEEIADYILQIENICEQTCKELTPMLIQLKT